ncbi:MAG: 30S ribosomal protein S8 [Candidatus Aenigmatarchaeota archaeon]
MKMRHDLLSDLLSAIKMGDRFGKTDAIVPASKLLKDVLIILQKNGYIGNFEYVDDGRGGKFKIGLTGGVNDCGSIRPRYAVTKDGYEKYERRFLPASGVGLLIVSAPSGVKTHMEAKEQKTGGKLLAYIY